MRCFSFDGPYCPHQHSHTMRCEILRQPRSYHFSSSSAPWPSKNKPNKNNLSHLIWANTCNGSSTFYRKVHQAGAMSVEAPKTNPSPSFFGIVSGAIGAAQTPKRSAQPQPPSTPPTKPTSRPPANRATTASPPCKLHKTVIGRSGRDAVDRLAGRRLCSPTRAAHLPAARAAALCRSSRRSAHHPHQMTMTTRSLRM